jgi:DNA-binding beta-propeller fold protein YncE
MPRLVHCVAAVVVMGIQAAACTPGGGSRPTGPAVVGEAADLTWPRPPDQARIRFVQVVARPQDLGIQPSFWRRVGRFITGKGEERFIRPTGVAVNGPVTYVADPGGRALWILDARARTARTIHEVDGQPLVSPVAVAIGRNESVYLADSSAARVFILDGGGRPVGSAAGPDLRSPAGLAYDGDRDRLYVADSAAHGVWVFTGDGKPLHKIGRRGIGEGEFNFPSHVAVDRNGTLYVTDALNFRLQVFNSDESFAGLFGEHGDSSGQFAMPKGVAIDSAGHVYVVEALFDAVQIFDGEGRYLLTFGERGVQAGQFWLPGGLFIDRRDRIYVADAYNGRIQVFEYLGGPGDE